jgi:hypothetical protein
LLGQFVAFLAIARTLHDTLLQSMQGLLYRFQSLLDRLPPADETRRLLLNELDWADRGVRQIGA